MYRWIPRRAKKDLRTPLRSPRVRPRSQMRPGIRWSCISRATETRNGDSTKKGEKSGPSIWWNSARWVRSTASFRKTRSMEKYFLGVKESWSRHSDSGSEAQPCQHNRSKSRLQALVSHVKDEQRLDFLKKITQKIDIYDGISIFFKDNSNKTIHAQPCRAGGSSSMSSPCIC